MEQIAKALVSRMRKQELLTFVKETILVMEMHDAEALHVNEMLVRLKALEPDFDLMVKKNSRSIAGIAQAKELEKSINNVLRALMLQLKAGKRMQYLLNADEVQLIQESFESVLKEAIPKNLSATVNICTALLNGLTENAELQAATSKLGLSIYLDELRNLLNNESLLRKAILKQQNERTKSMVTELSAKFSKCVSDLTKAIEVERIKHPELDYNALTNALNALNVRYRTVIKARTTRSKTESLNLNEATAATSTKTLAAVE
ncbi:MAG: hypothetical protein KA172_09815 [Paludibacter sp.]|jgi:hypothetical protein|nr:hypothetical protein [Paludibacter sp.]MBP8783659.1 hypothetical protein [Paludibacter sp.]MDX9919573.1 hypothetical protein [Paludibacter sp.]